MSVSCNVCREIGDQVVWGSSSMAEAPHRPDAVDRLETIDQDTRECPGCGARFRFDVEAEHASDHYMPDMRFTLTRVRSS